MKAFFCTAAGVIGGFIASAMGGMDWLAIALLIFMAVDYVSGWLVAVVFHNSKKTSSGAYSSNIGLKGLVRKAMMLCVVGMGVLMDKVLGVDYVRSMTIIGFLVNEGMSIFENLGLMGLDMPKGLTAALDVLADKAGATTTPATDTIEEVSADDLTADQLRSVLDQLGFSRTYIDGLTREQMLAELDKLAIDN